MGNLITEITSVRILKVTVFVPDCAGQNSVHDGCGDARTRCYYSTIKRERDLGDGRQYFMEQWLILVSISLRIESPLECVGGMLRFVNDNEYRLLLLGSNGR